MKVIFKFDECNFKSYVIVVYIWSVDFGGASFNFEDPLGATRTQMNQTLCDFGNAHVFWYIIFSAMIEYIKSLDEAVRL